MGHAENFLHEVVIDNHAQKRACRSHRVNLTKMARSNSGTYEAGQHFKLFLPIGLEKAVGEFPISEGTIKQEAGHGSIVLGPVKQSFCNSNQHFAEITLRSHQFTHAAIATPALDAIRQHRPKEVFLSSEVTKYK